MAFFKQLEQLNVSRQAEWDAQGKIDLSFKALEFLTEGGELGEQVKKLIRELNGLKGNRTDLTKIREEVGDVVITLQLLCTAISELTDDNIDIEQCVKDKFNKTSIKYDFETKWL